MDSPRSCNSNEIKTQPDASWTDTISPSLSLASKASPQPRSSSTSSIPSSPMYGSSTDAFSSAKRSLAEVKEEAHENEEDSHMGDLDDKYYHFDNDLNHANPARTVSTSSVTDASPYSPEDLGSELADSGSYVRLPQKKARPGDSPVSRTPSHVSNRFPSFSKRWKTRTGAGPKLSIETSQTSPSFSRANSRSNSAGSNVVSPALSVISRHEYTLPPSPARTFIEEPVPESDIAPFDIEQSAQDPEEEHGQATTPLLPPLLVNLSTNQDVPVQSPLQSPSVAETPILGTPSPAYTPQLPTLPSPPLSTKPSMASMRQRSRTGTLLPSAEIPPLQMTDVSDDIWSQKLGHANYKISPIPYKLDIVNLESYSQFRADWEMARSNYVKHLARTGEHYGTTSKIYKLTKEKWSEINQQWQEYNRNVNCRLDRKDAAILESSPSKSEPAATVTLLPIDDPSSRGKFPNMGDEDIVGPMDVAPAMSLSTETATQARLAKKRTFFKFLSDFLGRGTGLKI